MIVGGEPSRGAASSAIASPAYAAMMRSTSAARLADGGGSTTGAGWIQDVSLARLGRVQMTSTTSSAVGRRGTVWARSAGAGGPASLLAGRSARSHGTSAEGREAAEAATAASASRPTSALATGPRNGPAPTARRQTRMISIGDE